MSDNNNKNNNNDFLEQKLQEAGFYSMSIKYKKNKRIILMKLIESNMFTKPENHDGYHNQRPKRKNADFKMKIIPPS
jgi:regulatory protein YycI of two-component signal transduction system YycFG